MEKKVLDLTMDELLTVVKSEAIQLSSGKKESVAIVIRKQNSWETGEEYLSVAVARRKDNA